MKRTDLMRGDGENMAVRCFLMLYGGSLGCTVGQMRNHMASTGWEGLWPAWVDSENPIAHLTKGGAQDWLRHLFALEKTPVAWLCPGDPDAASAFKWAREGIDYSGLSCTCGRKHVPVFADLPTEVPDARPDSP